MSNPQTISLTDRRFSYKEAAQHLGCSEISLRRYVSQGKVDYLKIGGRVWFTREQLEDFLNRSLVRAEEAHR
jgi:excisionase family DNA binding protein